MNRFKYAALLIQEEKARSSARKGYEPNALGFLTRRGGDGHTVREGQRPGFGPCGTGGLRTCGKGLMRCEPLLEPVDQGGGDPWSSLPEPIPTEAEADQPTLRGSGLGSCPDKHRGGELEASQGDHGDQGHGRWGVWLWRSTAWTTFSSSWSFGRSWRWW